MLNVRNLDPHSASLSSCRAGFIGRHTRAGPKSCAKYADSATSIQNQKSRRSVEAVLAIWDAANYALSLVFTHGTQAWLVMVALKGRKRYKSGAVAHAHTPLAHAYIHVHVYVYALLHYITLHYMTLHYITLHYITLYYTTLHYITLHYTTLHYTTLHYITLYYMILH